MGLPLLRTNPNKAMTTTNTQAKTYCNKKKMQLEQTKQKM